MKKEEKILECEQMINLKVQPLKNNFLKKLSESDNDTKSNRLKAFQLMKNNTTNCAFKEKNVPNQSNNDDEINEIKGHGINNQSKNLFILNKFEQYYESKLVSNNQYNHEDLDNDDNKYHKFTLELKYTLGINTNSKGSICFHKEAKWVAYLNKNLVILETFEKESNRNQKILKDSLSYLSYVKLSENGSILMAFSNKFDHFKMSYPEIYFWNTRKDFILINKTVFKNNELNDCEISMQNNFCAVLSSNNESESYISILDFYNNEVLVRTSLTTKMISLKWNKFLMNMEFSTISLKKSAFWILNSNLSLHYQLCDFNDIVLENPEISFTCFEYSPPLSCNCNILLLIGLSNGEIWGIDTKTNSIAIKFNKANSINKPISMIICSIRYITIISSNIIKYYLFPSLRNMKHDDLNILVNKEENLELESEIISYDLDMVKSCGIALTKKGVLWYINYQEKAKLRLYVNIDEDSNITKIKVINKDFLKNTLRNLDYNNPMDEDLSPDSKNNEYYLFTVHKNGSLRLWSIPEYNIMSVFDAIIEELVAFEICPNEMKLVAAYKTGTLRFFDFKKSTCLGKYKTLSDEYYIFLKFLPDGKYLFLIDNYGNISLLKIEKWEPIGIQIHQLFNIPGEILNFNLNPIEPYNKFMINLNNVFLCVYDRKYTNLLKNLEYDSSTPQFYLFDNFNIEEYFDLQLKLDKADLIENFVIEFSPKEKNLIYILSQARKIMLLRNYENRINLRSIRFDKVHPIDYSLAPNNSFVIYILKDNRIQISQIGCDDGQLANYLFIPEEKLNFSISLNSKLLVISSENTLTSYIIY